MQHEYQSVKGLQLVQPTANTKYSKGCYQARINGTVLRLEGFMGIYEEHVTAGKTPVVTDEENTTGTGEQRTKTTAHTVP